jgi:hypothetical protein
MSKVLNVASWKDVEDTYTHINEHDRLGIFIRGSRNVSADTLIVLRWLDGISISGSSWRFGSVFKSGKKKNATLAQSGRDYDFVKHEIDSYMDLFLAYEENRSLWEKRGKANAQKSPSEFCPEKTVVIEADVLTDNAGVDELVFFLQAVGNFNVIADLSQPS